jgi:hypothetical protein
MEWIKIFLPLFGVALGWMLSESGKRNADKRQDKRKLKKLLFFLLELRFHFVRELSIKKGFDKYLSSVKSKLAVKFEVDGNDPEYILNIDALKPIIELLFERLRDHEKLEFLSVNIDNVIVDLAEIFPILAYELNGQHNIKERLGNFEKYFDEMKKFTNKVIICLR